MTRETLPEALRRHCLRTAEMIDKNVPTFLVVQELHSAWLAAWAIDPVSLAGVQANWMLKHARNFYGRCATKDCNCAVNPTVTYPAICEQCDAKFAAEVEEIDRDLEEGLNSE